MFCAPTELCPSTFIDPTFPAEQWDKCYFDEGMRIELGYCPMSAIEEQMPLNGWNCQDLKCNGNAFKNLPISPLAIQKKRQAASSCRPLFVISSRFRTTARDHFDDQQLSNNGTVMNMRKTLLQRRRHMSFTTAYQHMITCIRMRQPTSDFPRSGILPRLLLG